MGRTAEEVFGGVRSCPTGGTEVAWGPAHPHQETVKGRAEARAELGECRAVRAGEGGYLSRRRSRFFSFFRLGVAYAGEKCSSGV